jgi:hypothetical protein
MHCRAEFLAGAHSHFRCPAAGGTGEAADAVIGFQKGLFGDDSANPTVIGDRKGKCVLCRS